MPWNGSGNFSRTNGVNTGPNLWAEDAATVKTILSDRHDTQDQDIADGLNIALTKDGQTWPPTADLPMGGFKYTDVGDATARNHYLSQGQRQDGAGVWAGTATGTADVILLTLTPAITAYVTGMTLRFAVALDNTGVVTVNVNGIGAKSLLDIYGNELQAAALETDQIVHMSYDGTAFRVVSPLVSAAYLSTSPAIVNLMLGSNGSESEYFGGTSAKTVDYTVIESDHKKTILVDASAGDVTISLTAAATLADAFEVDIQKIDTSSTAVTIVPDGVETINGLGKLLLSAPYQSAKITGDGSEFYTTSEAGVGSRILLEMQAPNAASEVDFVLPVGFDKYEVDIIDLSVSSNQTAIRVRTSADGGTTFDAGASDYDSNTDGGTSFPNDHVLFSLVVGSSALSSAAGRRYQGTLSIYNPAEVNLTHMMGQYNYQAAGGTFQTATTYGYRNSSADVDAVRIYPSAGTITAKAVKLYGVR